MNSKDTNPNANVPRQNSDEPHGDRGQGDKTWSPEQGEQGISNRPDDAVGQETEDEDDDFDEDEDDDEDAEEDEDAEGVEGEEQTDAAKE
jgi:hypothetical protein